MGQRFSNFVDQSFRLAEPPLTEKNLSDQYGKVSIVTGGYAGCGKELARILYLRNGTVYVAGRSPDKANKAIDEIKAVAPDSKGRLEFLKLDLADLPSIKKSVDDFLYREEKLHVLTNNAGVMMPPAGSVDSTGHELQMGTNCLGPFLLTKLLLPTMEKTADTSRPGEVRATWGASCAIELGSPYHGIEFDEKGTPKLLAKHLNYGQTKCGNVFLATEHAKRFTGKSNVVHLAWNPGNLRTELQRHMISFMNMILGLLLYEPVYGAYTELFAGYSPNVRPEDSGRYVIPWGRFGTYRDGLVLATKSKQEGGTGTAEKFWEYCERETTPYLS